MSKVNNKCLIASAIIGALVFSGNNFAAENALTDLQKAEAKTLKQSVKSQVKINTIYEQTQDLLAEYRNTIDEADVLRGYNDHVQRMVDDQKQNITSLQKQIDGIDKIKQGVVPLMYKMIDTLETLY